jgi:pimeloyl-ACP methyl ester carboxylesterase
MADKDVALNYLSVNGARLAYFERGTRSKTRPSLLFVHATGFHGRVFDHIADAFPAYHIIALEQRGHGRSESLTIDHWRVMGEDMAAFVEGLGLEAIIGMGHSMGAHAMVDAAAISNRFARLLLLDPTIAAPQAYAEAPVIEAGVHPASRRKRHFDSPEDMIDRLLPKGAYALFHPRILDDYVRFGLVPVAGGGFELACRPEVEASVYMNARSNPGVYDSIRKLKIPVTVMRAREPEVRSMHDFSSSPTWPGLAGEFETGRDIHLPDCTHFIPMQMPEQVIDVLNEEIAAWQKPNQGQGQGQEAG